MDRQQPDREILREWPALVVGLLVLSLVWLVFSDHQPPLSSTEARLVGEWSANPSDITRTFAPDRTFSTSNGQFAGVWHIKDGRLTVTYWQQWRPPSDASLSSIQSAFTEFRRSRKSYVCTWDIEFSDSGQQHTLSHPVDDLQPDGKWYWTRVAVNNAQHAALP